jgi:hypothetical protein
LTSRSELRRYMALGVSDLLVKPVKPEIAHERLRRLFLTAGAWRQRKVAAGHGAREVLMLVEHDPNFRAFARPMLETMFEVVEVPSSAAAVAMYRSSECRPHVVCVGEGQQLLRESQFVHLLHQAVAEADAPAPRLYLLTANPGDPDHKRVQWDGIIRKTFVPHLFKEAFEKVAVRASDPRQRLEQLVRDEMGAELRTAVEQTLGVMSGQDLNPLDAAATAEVPAEVLAKVRLSGAAAGLAVDVQLLSARAQVEQIGARVLRRPVTFEKGGSEVFGELVNTIAGRIRASLGPRGYHLALETPEVTERTAEQTRPEWLVTLGVETTGGERLVLGLTVHEIPVAEGAGGGEREGEGALAQAVAGGAQEAPTVDDVLF